MKKERFLRLYSALLERYLDSKNIDEKQLAQLAKDGFIPKDQLFISSKGTVTSSYEELEVVTSGGISFTVLRLLADQITKNYIPALLLSGFKLLSTEEFAALSDDETSRLIEGRPWFADTRTPMQQAQGGHKRKHFVGILYKRGHHQLTHMLYYQSYSGYHIKNRNKRDGLENYTPRLPEVFYAGTILLMAKED